MNIKIEFKFEGVVKPNGQDIYVPLVMKHYANNIEDYGEVLHQFKELLAKEILKINLFYKEPLDTESDVPLYYKKEDIPFPYLNNVVTHENIKDYVYEYLGRW